MNEAVLLGNCTRSELLRIPDSIRDSVELVIEVLVVSPDLLKFLLQ